MVRKQHFGGLGWSQYRGQFHRLIAPRGQLFVRLEDNIRFFNIYDVEVASIVKLSERREWVRKVACSTNAALQGNPVPWQCSDSQARAVALSNLSLLSLSACRLVLFLGFFACHDPDARGFFGELKHHMVEMKRHTVVDQEHACGRHLSTRKMNKPDCYLTTVRKGYCHSRLACASYIDYDVLREQLGHGFCRWPT